MARAIGLEIKKCIVWKNERESAEQKDETSPATADDNQLLTELLER